MNAKERLDTFAAGKPTDRRPNLTIVGSVVTQYTGITVEDYCKNARAMAEAALACARDAALDYVQIASDLVREAEAFGSQIEYFPDKLPTVVRPALSDIRDALALKPLDIKATPRLWALVEATAYALKAEPDIWPMTLCVGPATVAGNTRGVQEFMMDLFDEPEACAHLLNIAAETTCALIDELAAVGAKWLYVADPVASLLSPSLYEELVLPCHRRIFERMAQHGITGRLHMCGDTRRLLPSLAGCGARIVDIDHAVPFADALEAVQGRCILNGNIDPVADVFDCDAEHTRQAVLAADSAAHHAQNAMYMPGCELPTRTPLANLHAIAKALAELGV